MGCLFAHMLNWQLAADNGNKHTYVMESDGLDPALLAVPVGALGRAVQIDSIKPRVESAYGFSA